MTIKELFEKSENGTLTWEQFQTAMTESNAKFVDLNEGGYVSKHKYESELTSKANEIETLNSTIKTRDNDLSNLQNQLKEAGVDSGKLEELTNNLTQLQTKYNDDMKAYKKQIAKQAYEFAVKEFASTKQFSSQAAKRDFVQSMIAKELKMENDKILGADDFVATYQQDNADAFAIENSKDTKPQPTFVSPTQGAEPAPKDQNAFLNAFHFTGVRTMPTTNQT